MPAAVPPAAEHKKPATPPASVGNKPGAAASKPDASPGRQAAAGGPAQAGKNLGRPAPAGKNQAVAPPAGATRRAVQPRGVRVPRPPPAAGRAHGLGPDPRPARRHVAEGAGALRQPVQRAVVALARHRDHDPHGRGCVPLAARRVASRRRAPERLRGGGHAVTARRRRRPRGRRAPHRSLTAPPLPTAAAARVHMAVMVARSARLDRTRPVIGRARDHGA